MKRIMIVLLAIVILLSCVACDNNSPKDDDNDKKIVSEYMGEWKANSLKSRDNDEITYKVATITLQEDGTCVYKGENAKWEYVADLNQFIFTLDKNGVSGTLEIAEENGKTVLKYNTETYYRPTDFIVKEKEYVNVGNTYSCKKEIEITLDNWNQYFEIVENTDWRKNAFGEAENLNIFKLKFDRGEFDMVIYDSNLDSCAIYEIKHSGKVVDSQYRHLLNEDLCNQTERRFGEIAAKTVLYRGESHDEIPDIEYRNAADFLKALPESMDIDQGQGFTMDLC